MKRLKQLCCGAGLLFVLSAGCSATPDSEDGVHVGQSGATIFDQGIQDFSLSLSAAAIRSLTAAPKDEVDGTFKHREKTYRVTVRLKGMASLQGFDAKPAFKIKFVDEEFFGLKRLTLNNMVQDPTMVRETLAYTAFAALGAAVPRTSYARVAVNGKPYGLYLNLESIDKKFLKRSFSDASGALYEGTYGQDVSSADVDNLDLEEGDESRAPLRELVRAVEHGPAEALFYGDGAKLEMKNFLATMAADALTGNWDGYWKANNYRLYFEPTAKRWSLIPTGLDQSLRDSIDIFAVHSVLYQKCLDTPRCLVDYVETLRRGAATFDALNLTATMDRTLGAIDAIAKRDPRRPYSPADMDAARRDLKTFIATRVRAIAPKFSCVENGKEVDRDGDHFGACIQDCDDSNAAIKPGAREACDQIDNNCNGNVDEVPECGCPTKTIGGATFSFCPHLMTFSEAERFCKDQRATLGRIDDARQNIAVHAEMQRAMKTRWWIGLSDRRREGQWVWLDGTAPRYSAWSQDEPNDWGQSEDCAEMGSSSPRWNDIDCESTRHPFICRSE